MGKPANVKLIDTLILAKHVWPGLSSYSQNALMLSIEGLQPDPDYESVLKMQANAHSAKFDIINLTYILQPMLSKLCMQYVTWEDLYNLCESLRIPTVIEFGKYAGTPFAELPPDYLKWMLRQDFDQYIMTAVKRALGQHLA